MLNIATETSTKRERIVSILSDPETANFSSRQIAKMCNASKTYVEEIRKETTGNSTGNHPSDLWHVPTGNSSDRKCSDGKTRDVTNIGRSPRKKSKGLYSCERVIPGKNSDLIAQVVKFYAFPGAYIADVTWGKGAFWKSTKLSQYNFKPSDISDGIDFRNLPYDDDTFDVVVLDPPYAHHPGKFLTDATYNNNATTKGMSHNDIQQLYRDGIQEAKRVLKDGGLLWVKCQDEIESSRQRYSHIEIYESACQLGFYAKDLFILQQDIPPVIQIKQQQHSRKNHSYLWIFRKGGLKKG